MVCFKTAQTISQSEVSYTFLKHTRLFPGLYIGQKMTIVISGNNLQVFSVQCKVRQV